MEAKLTILVSEELRRAAKAATSLRGETVSQVVRDALEQYVLDVLGPDALAKAQQKPTRKD